MGYTTDLVYALYGVDKTASKALKGVGKEAGNAGEQFKHMGKVAAASFAVAAAAAGKFAFDAAKAAAEDEKSQKLLAASIKNTAKATDAQVKSTEDFITKMQLTYGIADDKLRPAFATLTRATGDLGESQNLMQVAMDISSATGKDLSTTSLALAKAHEGNIGALTRLGIPLDKSIIKNKDFNAALKVLTETFNGSAKAGADTFSGRMAIMTEHIKESKEQIGYALMPVMESMATYLTDTVVPNVQSFVDGLTGVKNSSGDAYDSIYQLGEKTKEFFKFLADHEEVLKRIATVIGAIFIGSKAAAAAKLMITALQTLLIPFGEVTAAAGTAAAAEAAATGGASLAIAAPAIIGIAAALGLGGLAAMYTWSDNKTETPEETQRRLQTGVAVVGSSDPGTAQKWQDLHSPASAQAGNGLVWFNGFKQFERPFMHSVKNQPLFGSHVTAPGTDRFGYRALGGPVASGASYIVGERGPELLTMGNNNGFVTPNNRLGGVNVVVNVSGSVIHERDLAVAVRDNIAQLMRRRGLNPAILGV